jgi:nitrate/nitrite transporter NarK
VVVLLVVIVGCVAQWESVRAVSKGREEKARREEKVKSDMHIVVDTYLVMQMHIAIFGVGLAFLFFFPDDGDC